MEVTICSSFSGRSDEFGNKLVMFSRISIFLKQCFFLSFVFTLSHTDVPRQPRMTEGEQRKRWRRWRKQKWDTDRSWDTETGAEEGCQNSGDWSRQHSGAFGFEVSILWQAEVTDAPRTGKPSSHNDAIHFAINQCVTKWGKDERMRVRKEERHFCNIYIPFSFVCKAGFKSVPISSQQPMSDDNTSALASQTITLTIYSKCANDIKLKTLLAAGHWNYFYALLLLFGH